MIPPEQGERGRSEPVSLAVEREGRPTVLRDEEVRMRGRRRKEWRMRLDSLRRVGVRKGRMMWRNEGLGLDEGSGGEVRERRMTGRHERREGEGRSQGQKVLRERWERRRRGPIPDKVAGKSYTMGRKGDGGAQCRPRGPQVKTPAEPLGNQVQPSRRQVNPVPAK